MSDPNESTATPVVTDRQIGRVVAQIILGLYAAASAVWFVGQLSADPTDPLAVCLAVSGVVVFSVSTLVLRRQASTTARCFVTVAALLLSGTALTLATLVFVQDITQHDDVLDGFAAMIAGIVGVAVLPLFIAGVLSLRFWLAGVHARKATEL